MGLREGHIHVFCSSRMGTTFSEDYDTAFLASLGLMKMVWNVPQDDPDGREYLKVGNILLTLSFTTHE